MCLKCGSATQSSIGLIGDGGTYDEMTDSEFAGIINTIPAHKKVIQLSLNYAGGFLNETLYTEENLLVDVSSIDTPSYRADDQTRVRASVIENEVINARTYYHGEFNFHRYISTVGLTPSGEDNYNGALLNSVDVNNDGIFSVSESFSWFYNNESTIETPAAYSPNHFGFHTSLEYPTLLHNPLGGGYLARNFGLKGIIGLVNDMHIETDMVQFWDELTFEDNSHTTFLENKNLSISDLGDVRFGNNSIIEGKGNNNITLDGYYSELHTNNTTFKNIDISHTSIDNIIRVVGQTTFDNVNYMNRQASLTSELASYVNLVNGTNFTIKNKYYMMEDYFESFDNISSVNVDNSSLILDDSCIESYEFETNVTNGGKVIVANEEVGSPYHDLVMIYTPVNMTENSTYEVMPNARAYQYSHLNISDGATLQIDENGIFGGSFSMGEYSNVLFFNNARFWGNLTANVGCKVEVQENSAFRIETGRTFTINGGAKLRLLAGSELVIEEGANLILEEGARVEIVGNAKITGDVNNILGRIAVTTDSQLTLGAGSSIDFGYISVSSLILGANSELVIESGAVLNLGTSTQVEGFSGSKITVQDGGTLTAGEESSFTGINTWQGITCEVGGIIQMDGTIISGAATAITGTPSQFEFTNSTIENCSYGIKLINCNNYNIEDNVLTGNDLGVAISVTGSNGEIRDNTLRNFSHGIVIILCSPYVAKNMIRDNVMNGIYLTGNNTYPQLIDQLEDKIIVNNHIVNNGINTTDERNAQIRMVYPANAYMYYGMNNVYYHENAPAILAQSNMSSTQQKSLTTPYVSIPAQYNYWGVYEINTDNSYDIFDIWRPSTLDGYRINYSDYRVSPFTTGGLPVTSLNGTLDLEAKFLAQAIKAEFDGKIDLAIKKYEKLIDRYPSSEENYIALTRLTDLLAKQEESLEQLMAIYDENIDAEDETINKQFYKEMKIAANIKSKKYDEAIALAEELKAQALNDNDILLADIDIAMANMMKNAQSKGKSTYDSSTISNLLTKLTGAETKGEGEKTDIVESALPTEFTLHQNYPNPFNPTTEISYALSQDANVSIKVYSSNGSVVADLVNASQSIGQHSVTFDASKLSNGIFYYSLVANGRVVSTKKMLLLK